MIVFPFLCVLLSFANNIKLKCRKSYLVFQPKPPRIIKKLVHVTASLSNMPIRYKMNKVMGDLSALSFSAAVTVCLYLQYFTRLYVFLLPYLCFTTHYIYVSPPCTVPSFN